MATRLLNSWNVASIELIDEGWEAVERVPASVTATASETSIACNFSAIKTACAWRWLDVAFLRRLAYWLLKKYTPKQSVYKHNVTSDDWYSESHGQEERRFEAQRQRRQE